MRNYLEGTETQKQRAYSPAVVTQGGRTPNFLGMIVRVVIVQQLTRGLGRGAGRAARVVTR